MIKKYKNLPNSIKASIWFMICSILQKGITFITIPIFTRIMTTSEYGRLSVFLSWQEIVSIFATLNLNYQIFNNGMIKFNKDRDGYTISMVGLGFLSSVISFLIILCFYSIWFKYTKIDIVLLLFMFINMYSLLVVGIWTVRNRFDFDYKLLTILTIIFSILNPALGIILVKISTNKVLFRVLSLALSSLCFAIISFILMFKKSKKIIVSEYWKYALKLSIPLIPHYISMVILHSSDRIMIGNIVSEEAAAFYSISYNVALVMQIILNSINSSFIPWVYQRMEKEEYTAIKKYSKLLIIAVATITLIPMFLAPEAIMILGGSKYFDAIKIVPILSTSVFMIFFYSIFIIIEMYYEKSSYITLGSVLAAIINLFLNYIFIEKFGYKAAAYTTLTSYILLALFHYIMYRKVCLSNSIKEEIFDSKIMFIISSILILISILVTITYDYIILRICLFLLLLIVLLANVQKIKKILCEIKRR